MGEFKNVTPLRNDETWGLRKLVENELTKECFASGNSGNIRVIIGPVSPNKDLQEITEGIQGLQIRWTFEERLKLLTGVLIKNLPETTAGVPDVIASIPDIIASIPEIKDKKETREGRLELLEKLLERMLQTSDLKWDGMAGIVGTRTRIGCKSQWHDQAKKKRLSDWLFQD
ncbi:4914_t:CDS:2 [Ambispora gerdemannii]|uniref:4914_t:CDS:1 n=1 Tax=Ambispora gerdemannii TaxID=144530 RepID=A0A9N8Z7B3_9GLOM|nr:4914_t:CDS:2 [Ambispora gerdemannii]